GAGIVDGTGVDVRIALGEDHAATVVEVARGDVHAGAADQAAGSARLSVDQRLSAGVDGQLAGRLRQSGGVVQDAAADVERAFGAGQRAARVVERMAARVHLPIAADDGAAGSVQSVAG